MSGYECGEEKPSRRILILYLYTTDSLSHLPCGLVRQRRKISDIRRMAAEMLAMIGEQAAEQTQWLSIPLALLGV